MAFAVTLFSFFDSFEMLLKRFWKLRKWNFLQQHFMAFKWSHRRPTVCVAISRKGILPIHRRGIRYAIDPTGLGNVVGPLVVIEKSADAQWMSSVSSVNARSVDAYSVDARSASRWQYWRISNLVTKRWCECFDGKVARLDWPADRRFSIGNFSIETFVDS